MTELAKPQLERYDSQSINKDICKALEHEKPLKPKDEIIRKRLYSSTENEMETMITGE